MRAGRGPIPITQVGNKRVWRCVPSLFMQTALESGPSFTKDRRYSVQGEFGAVYLSGSQALSQLESDERGGGDAEPVSCLAFELTLDKLVDLTRKETRRYFGVQLDDLVRPRTARDRYTITQELARRVYAGCLNGLISPSVHDPSLQQPDWFNVVLYPAHLLRRCLRPVKEKPSPEK